MYIQNLFVETDKEVLHQFIRSVCFGTLVLSDGNEFEANPIPFEVVSDKQDLGILRAHVSSKNPCCEIARKNPNALVTFVGPNAYISPSWMPGSKSHRKVAPSWNYGAVHVTGRVEVINDKKWIIKHIARLTANLESRRENPWRFKDADADFIQSMPTYITGIEITITDIQGKFQASQQYSQRTRAAIQEGLLNENGDMGKQVNRMIADRNK